MAELNNKNEWLAVSADVEAAFILYENKRGISKRALCFWRTVFFNISSVKTREFTCLPVSSRVSENFL